MCDKFFFAPTFITHPEVFWKLIVSYCHKITYQKFQQKDQLKTAKIRANNFHSLQSYVSTIWANTRKWQKCFWAKLSRVKIFALIYM